MINRKKFKENLRKKGFDEKEICVIHTALEDSEEPSYSPD